MKGFVRNAIAMVCLLSTYQTFGQSIPCANINLNNSDTIIVDCVPNDTCIEITANLSDIRQVADIPNAYVPEAIPFSGHFPFEMTGATQVLVNQDDAYSGLISLPFTFCFYGSQYNQIVIGANGTLSFHAPYANQSSGFEMCSNGTWYSGPTTPGLPNSFSSSQWGWDSYPRNAIFACFQDTDPTAPAVNKGIEWKLEGVAPCRKLIVNWRNVPQFSCTSNTTTFQCVLYENTNVIEIYVSEKPLCTTWNCGYAVIGVQNSSRTLAVTPPNRNGTIWETTTSTSEAWRFVPNGPSLLEQVVLKNSNNQIVEVGTVVMPQSGTLTASFNNVCIGNALGNVAQYYVEAQYTSCSDPTSGFHARDSLVLIRSPFTSNPIVANLSYCINEPTQPLSAIGTDLLWYTQSAGGTGTTTPPTPSSDVPGSTTWYVSQTIDGCEGFRSPLTVMVNPYKTGTKNINLCPGQSVVFNGSTFSGPLLGFTDTLSTAGCDSILTINVYQINTIYNTINASICNGQSHTYNNVTYTSSATVHTTYTSSGGCDSIVTFNLAVFPYVTGTSHATICQGQTYTHNGHTYSSDTSFIYGTYVTDSGCDSVVTFTLHVIPYKQGLTTATICQNQNYTFLGNTYYSSFSGNVDTVQTLTGCDSIIALNLTVIPFLTGTINKTICQGKSFLFNNVNYSASVFGVKDTVLSVGGCDSIITLNLTVTPYLTSTINANICPGQTYLFNGINYNNTVSGIKDTFQTISGCDSIVTLNLNTITYVTGVQYATICQGQSYTFNNIDYTTSTYGVTDTLTSIGGCDSIVSLALTVQPYLTAWNNVTICYGQSYTYHGNTYTSSISGVIDTLPDIAGCSVIHNFNLTVAQPIIDTINAFICQGKAYLFKDSLLTESAFGLMDTLIGPNGCDSILVLNLMVNPSVNLQDNITICHAELPFTWRGITVAAGGMGVASDTIPALKGCDSSVTLNLNVIPAPTLVEVDSSGCEHVAFKDSIYNQSTTIYESLPYTFWAACDSIIYKTNVIVNHHISDTTYANICEGQKYTHNSNDYNNSGFYKDLYISSTGCDSFSVLALNVSPLPVIDINFIHDNYCIYDTVTLVGAGAIDYRWSFNQISNQSGDKALVPLENSANIIRLIGIDENNCTDSTQIQIDTKACCEMDMPNAFSPNGDGSNDYFKPFTKGNPKFYSLSIYNRLGQKIFQTSDIDKGWDGNYNGVAVDIGTYHFWIVKECANGERTKVKGDLILIR